VVELEELANNLDEHFKKISKAKVGGAAKYTIGSKVKYFTNKTSI
jgi:hypothetical protein